MRSSRTLAMTYKKSLGIEVRELKKQYNKKLREEAKKYRDEEKKNHERHARNAAYIRRDPVINHFLKNTPNEMEKLDDLREFSTKMRGELQDPAKRAELAKHELTPEKVAEGAKRVANAMAEYCLPEESPAIKSNFNKIKTERKIQCQGIVDKSNSEFKDTYDSVFKVCKNEDKTGYAALNKAVIQSYDNSSGPHWLAHYTSSGRKLLWQYLSDMAHSQASQGAGNPKTVVSPLHFKTWSKDYAASARYANVQSISFPSNAVNPGTTNNPTTNGKTWTPVDYSIVKKEQDTADLRELMLQAANVHGRFVNWLTKYFKKSFWEESRPAPMKALMRCWEKVALRGGSAKTISDIVRGSIVAESMQDLIEAVQFFMGFDHRVGGSLERWEEKKKADVAAAGGAGTPPLALNFADMIEVVEIKNRFKQPSESGWADMQILFKFVEKVEYVEVDEADEEGKKAGFMGNAGNKVWKKVVTTNPHIMEIQVIHRKLLLARKDLGGHAYYNASRNASEFLSVLNGEKKLYRP